MGCNLHNNEVETAFGDLPSEVQQLINRCDHWCNKTWLPSDIVYILHPDKNVMININGNEYCAFPECYVDGKESIMQLSYLKNMPDQLSVINLEEKGAWSIYEASSILFEKIDTFFN